jgi:hypothetical protein
VLDGRPVYATINDTDADSNLEAVGFESRRLNQLPLMFRFRAFHENRLPFTVHVQNAKRPATARLTLTSSGHPPKADNQTTSGASQTGSIDIRLPDWSGVDVPDVEPQEVERKLAPTLSAPPQPGEFCLVYDQLQMSVNNDQVSLIGKVLNTNARPCVLLWIRQLTVRMTYVFSIASVFTIQCL